MTDTDFALTAVEMPVEITDRKAQAAEALGLEAERIGVVRLETSALRRNGLLVSVMVQGISMFTRQAEWYEMGVPLDDIRAGRFTRGRKFLFPEDIVKQFGSIEVSARTLLDKLSYDVSAFRPYRFIPVTAYAEFRSAWDRLADRFEVLRNYILAHYDEYLEQFEEDFSLVADASWRSLNAQGYQVAVIAGRPYDNLESYRNELIRRAMSKMPSREQIQYNLRIDYRTALLWGSSDDAAAEAIRARALAEAEVQKANLAAARSAEHEAEEKLAHTLRMDRLEQQEKELKVEAMMAAEAEHIRGQLSQIASPYDEVFAELRRRIGQSVVEIRDSVNKSGFVRGKVAERGRGLLEFFDLMCTHDDAELRNKLVGLKAALDKPAGGSDAAVNRSTSEVLQALNDISGLVDATADALASGPSRFSMID